MELCSLKHPAPGAHSCTLHKWMNRTIAHLFARQKKKKKDLTYPASYTKITLKKWVIVLNVKCKPIKLLEDTGENICDFGLGEEFLDTKSIICKRNSW